MINKTILDKLAAAEASSGAKVHESGELPVSAIVFSPELLESCASNVCGHYNTSWTCPPNSGTLEGQKALINKYTNAFVFTTRHILEDSFDYEGMTIGKDLHTLLTLELKTMLGGGVPVYGAGSCPICRDKEGNIHCAFPNPCPTPDKRIGSIEAAGINVTLLSKSAGVTYNNGPNTVTYFSMILY